MDSAKLNCKSNPSSIGKWHISIAKKCLFTLTVLVTESLKAVEGRGLVGGEDHEADSKGCNLLAADSFVKLSDCR